MKKPRAFTLVELLVSISIVALLASIVLASLNSARTKASFAAAKRFSFSTDNAISYAAAGWWDFDECSGSSTVDKSGNSGNASLMSTAGWSASSPTGNGCSGSFNGTTDYVEIPGSNSATSPLNITGTAVTVMAWVNITGSGSGYRQVIARNSGGASWQRQYELKVILSSYTLGCAFATDDAVFELPYGYVSPNTWHHLACVYTGSRVQHYIDGVQILSVPLTGPLMTQPGAYTRIGAMFSGTNMFPGLIDNVRIIPTALAVTKMQEIYAAEAPQYGITLK